MTTAQDTNKRTYGLIGYPLGHSFSKDYFTRLFEKEGLDAEYKNFEIPFIDNLATILNEETSLQGFNVTIPYKQQVIPLLDEVDEAASDIGAVNVVKVTHHEEGVYLKGYNTDVIGFAHSIRPLLQSHHTHALILGTGGASKAVNYALRQMGIETCFVSRTPSDTSEHAPISYTDLTSKMMKHYTVIVNTTPLGMYPKVDQCPPIDYAQLNSSHLLFDVVYNPTKTLFLQRSEEAGATICNGMEMLIGQAKAAWSIWNSD